jgi:hypothetical protein
MAEADKVQRYWDAKRQPVPTVYDIEMARREQEEDRPW